MTNSRAKGARGEREWAEALRTLFGCSEARRGCQYAGRAVSGDDTPDVVNGIPGTHPEVKRTERLSLYAAVAQAVDDCGENVPYVAHRRNRGDWLVIVRATDLEDLSRAVIAVVDEDAK